MTMKKVYVTPVATTVAFVVNENIATSRQPDESWTGEGTYSQEPAGKCNDVFNSTDVKTHLQPGEIDIQKALANVQYYEPHRLNEILAILASGKFNCY